MTQREYKLLKQLANDFPDVALLALPSAQFGNQEAKTSEEIIAFAAKHGPESLIVCDKQDVNGDNARPIYKYIKSVIPKFKPTWNFRGKFLVSKDGNIQLTEDPVKDIPPLLEQC